MGDDLQHRTFSARLDCHYLLRLPETIDSQTLLVVTLHGFGQSPDMMLPLTGKMFGPHHAVAALQGPNQFFLNNKVQEVGYGWNTNRHAASAIRLHHDMVQQVLHDAGREYGIPPERRILVGFSQPVSLNYRFVATCPGAVRGVVGICGGLPGDWETGSYQPVTAAVLHIARKQDEWYPPAVTEQYGERLRLRVMDWEFHQLEGGHNFPSKGHAIAERWLERILR
jgi:phospholipase/carboxylesterase